MTKNDLLRHMVAGDAIPYQYRPRASEDKDCLTCRRGIPKGKGYMDYQFDDGTIHPVCEPCDKVVREGGRRFHVPGC